MYFTVTGFYHAPFPPKPRHLHHCIWFFTLCTSFCVLSYSMLLFSTSQRTDASILDPED
jgi:hypothetical protein